MPLLWRSATVLSLLVSSFISSTSVSLWTASAFDLPFNATFPKYMTLRAAVLTNTVPLAYYDTDIPSTPSINNIQQPPDQNLESFPHYRGFQPDLLRQLQQIAKADNVTLSFQLEQAPPFSYTEQFEYVANDCNTTGNPYKLSKEECHRYDLIVGDFYGYPSRSIRTLLTAPLLTTAAATLQYHLRQKRIISTLEEARVLQEPVCLLKKSHYDDQTIERFPGINVTWCDHHTQCIEQLKNESCALFVEDELQLRYMMVQDAQLEVTQERFDEQYIVWPINARLDPLYQQLIVRWIYQAKVSGVLDQLYNQYFRLNFCPIGRAGENCEERCSPSKGLADRHGTCVCESTKWTGNDCSIEVMEDKHLIPPALAIACYLMIGINFSMVTVCAIWMFVHRKTAQIKVAQPLFLGLVLVGCLISTSTIFALLAEDGGQGPVHACAAIPWLYSVGFSITFGTLFAKIRRVYLLFKAATHMQRLTISVRETFLTIGAILVVDVAILTTWTLVDALQWQRTVLVADQFGNPLSSIGFCSSKLLLPFVGAIAALHFTLLVLACYMCFAARDIPTEFSESKYVSIAMISNLQIFVVGLPILVILGSESETAVFVRSAIVWMNDFVVVSLIFGNLIYNVHWDPNRPSHSSNRAEFIRATMDSYMSNNRAAARGRNANVTYAITEEEGTGTARGFSTFAPSRILESDAEEGTHHEDDVGALPVVVMSVSETEPRLHVDAGNGQTATIPITQINFDVSGSEKPDSILPSL